MNLTETQVAAVLEFVSDGVEMLARIERHLGVLAEYAEMLRQKETGEKVYEVQSYVVSTTSNGDMCVYLYSTHPGLQYRVCTVYEERLADLPLTIPGDAKIWDGEAAPSREGAAKKGYMLAAPHPFKVSLMPTGGTTDAGLPVHKFSRVVSAEPAQAPAPAAQQAQDKPRPSAPPPNGNGVKSAEDRHAEQLRREMEARKAAASRKPETPPERFARLARETGIGETEAGELLRYRQGDYAKAADDLQAQRDADEFDRMRSATEDPAVQEALAKAERKLASKDPVPASQPPANHDDMLAELHRLAASAKNPEAARNIAGSVERQKAAPNFPAILSNAIATLQKMQ